MNVRSTIKSCAVWALAVGAYFGGAASHAATLSGSYSVHDPSRIALCDGKYYVYYTGPHCPMHWSTDLVHWADGPNVLDKLPAWAHEAVPLAKNDDAWIWAPDVIKVGKLYYMFWSLSTWGSRVSTIGLSVSKSLDPKSRDYGWWDKGMVVHSLDHSDFNAIDPCPIIDTKGYLWMTYGSWLKDGIQIVKLDKNTGKPVSTPVTLAAKAAAGPEASFIYYHTGYYYLFGSDGTCCQGTHSTYHVVMGRSKSITGPYLDKTGRDLRDGGGALFLAADGDKIGPGQIGISPDNHGREVLSYHYYDGTRNGWPEMGIDDMKWSRAGWPVVPWHASPTIADGTYAVISKLTGLAMTIDNPTNADGAAISQKPFGGMPQQVWRLEYTNDGFYRLVSAASGKALDLWTCSEADGTKIDQYPWFDNACQHWKIEKQGADAWSIRSMAGGGAISTATKDSIAGTPVLAYAFKGDANQQWEFRPLDKSTAKLSEARK